MKRIGTFAVCLATGLAFTAGLRAASPAPANPALPDDPYSVVVDRNIFGLKPPPPPPDPNEKVKEILPKISPTGIMGYFGHWKVLFKVAPVPKGGQSAKDEVYILSEGEAQDEIEVSKIDEKNSLVTFINHGTEQALPLVAPKSSGAAPTGGPAGTAPQQPVPMPIGGNPGNANSSPISFSGGGRLGVHTSGGNPGDPNNGVPLNFGNSGANNYVSPQQQNNLPADARTILMEAQRAQWQTANKPHLNPALIPPTPLTELNKAEGKGGVPGPPAP